METFRGLIDGPVEIHWCEFAVSSVAEKGKSVINVEAHDPTLFMFDFNGAEICGLMTLQGYRMTLEVYPPAEGSHKLQIFAKPFNSSMSIYARVLRYRVDCSSVHSTMKIPKALSNPVGPNWMTEQKGFLQPSHTNAIIHTHDGRCSVSFRLKEDMDVLATLHSDEMEMTEDMKRRHIFKSQFEKQVVLKIQIPQAGTFVLKIFSRIKGAKDTRYVYTLCYLLSCTNVAVTWPVFPEVYTAWLDSYELVEPTAGVLPANQNVQFKLKVPGVNSVLINDKKMGSLTLSADGYWEGAFNTAGCKELNVLTQETPRQKQYVVILSYQVETQKK
ncbi:hypothetical protein NDU88_002277 [Pleurodeles waltl]|uniref:KY-like immunoglobulin-like domain-containing protein n=1 Tax=Pleurodeles waltl TaxID=8319 RepID=A0AAV7LF86_PLEWA|nr:hypothetical protein NDU88_002277 [Pleurodeles waltl]